MKTSYRKLLALNLVLLLALTLFALPVLAAANESLVGSWYMNGYGSPVFTVEQDGDYRVVVDNYNPMTPLTIMLYDNSFSCLGSSQSGFSCHLTANASYQLRSTQDFMGSAEVYLYLVKADNATIDPTLAYTSTQNVLVDGKSVEFQCYALKDEKGNDTNYIKLRDVAKVLNGTAAQFEVGWDGAINIETGKAYTPNGSEMSTPFSGNRAYEDATAPTNVNGAPVSLSAILLRDDAGSGYTYYKLRDLGDALGFKVDWTSEKGIFIETK